MKLIPKEIEATLPHLYSQENVPGPVAVVRLFDPCGPYTFLKDSRSQTPLQRGAGHATARPPLFKHFQRSQAL